MKKTDERITLEYVDHKMLVGKELLLTNNAEALLGCFYEGNIAVLGKMLDVTIVEFGGVYIVH